MRTRAVVACAIGAAVVALSAAGARAVTFAKVADRATVIPAGQWAGQTFGSFTSSGITSPPAMDHGKVLFLATPSSGAVNGAYIWSGGAIGLLADPSVAIPGRGATTFSGVRYPSVNGGEYAFSSYDGIYRTVGGVLTRVIDPATVAPPTGSTFDGTSAPSLDGGATWFYGELNDANFTEGVYRSVGGALSAVVTDGMATPGSPGNFFNSLNSNVSGSRGRVAFYGESGPTAGQSPVRGIYQYDGSVVRRVADTSMAAPGGGTFTGFSNFPLSDDGASVAFIASAGGVSGVYAERGGVLQAVAVSGQPAPGGGAYGGMAGLSLDSGHVAVWAGSAVYTDVIGGTMTRAFGAGDVIGGKTLSSVALGPEGLDYYSVAFYGQFTDGSSGVFVAALPEPSLAGVLGAAVVGRVVLGRRRRDGLLGGAR